MTKSLKGFFVKKYKIIDNPAVKVSIFYLIFGCAWIFLSDNILQHLVKSEEIFFKYQTYKGWFFIFITGLFLFTLLQRHFQLQKKAEELISKSHQSLRLLTAHMETVREEERVKIAREIHDELGQALTGLKMDIVWISKRIDDGSPLIEKFELLLQNINTTIKTVRKISSELRPAELDDLGLVAALESEAEDFMRRTEIKNVFNPCVDNINIPDDIAVTVFRIYQEALTNITKHSGASKVTTDIWFEDEKLFLKVEDDGKGITENEMNKKGSFGLLGMKERADIAGGEVKIFGSEQKGTVVLLQVPLNNL